MIRSLSRPFAAVALAAILGLAAAGAASASAWPDRNSNTRDDVTGYLCITPGCDVVRLPQTKCLCTKDNPSERNLRKLRLTCHISEAGRWQACPVSPPFGN
ncbi:hypothetical protein FQ775_08780 [Nitratireductor mangrovi]|uniref:Secreted protein n=1 Tax=Nitratireductor mangrovi TaxID=2599600 RepID=A0A5B8KY57_9HYPH|nr:hypothetical protein [Nitratireductor mangrovi]QDZ00466.1 hypothetical protein FQ775_08780 [Nitratireductor mangrovi]